jgi:hypothetical protein
MDALRVALPLVFGVAAAAYAARSVHQDESKRARRWWTKTATLSNAIVASIVFGVAVGSGAWFVLTLMATGWGIAWRVAAWTAAFVYAWVAIAVMRAELSKGCSPTRAVLAGVLWLPISVALR